MKKLIAILLVIAVAAGVGTVVYMRYTSVDNRILGKWEGSNEIGSLEFKKDGVVVVGLLSAAVDGTYIINSEDKDNMTLSLTYKTGGISFTRDYNLTLVDNVLTLVDDSLIKVTLVYNRVVEE